jgi:hypothetical protein
MRYHKTVLLNSLLTEFIQVNEKMNKYMNRVPPDKWDEQLNVYSNHLKMVLEEFNKIKNSINSELYYSGNNNGTSSL